MKIASSSAIVRRPAVMEPLECRQFLSVTAAPLPNVGIRVADATAYETTHHAGKFVISRTGSTGKSLKVEYSIKGTATNGIDYDKLSGTVTIPAGKSSVNLLIHPIKDNTPDSGETVVIRLKTEPRYGFAAGHRSGTVTIDDVPPTVPALLYEAADPAALASSVIGKTYLNLNGILGSSVDSKFVNQIEINSFSYAITQSGGIPVFSDFAFSHAIDRSDPKLLDDAATGRHITTAVISVTAGTAENVILKYALSDVVVTSVQTTISATGDVDTFSLSYSKIQVTYTTYKSDGTPSGSVVAQWSKSAGTGV